MHCAFRVGPAPLPSMILIPVGPAVHDDSDVRRGHQALCLGRRKRRPKRSGRGVDGAGHRASWDGTTASFAFLLRGRGRPAPALRHQAELLPPALGTLRALDLGEARRALQDVVDRGPTWSRSQTTHDISRVGRSSFSKSGAPRQVVLGAGRVLAEQRDAGLGVPERRFSSRANTRGWRRMMRSIRRGAMLKGGFETSSSASSSSIARASTPWTPYPRSCRSVATTSCPRSSRRRQMAPSPQQNSCTLP